MNELPTYFFICQFSTSIELFLNKGRLSLSDTLTSNQETGSDILSALRFIRELSTVSCLGESSVKCFDQTKLRSMFSLRFLMFKFLLMKGDCWTSS